MSPFPREQNIILEGCLQAGDQVRPLFLSVIGQILNILGLGAQSGSGTGRLMSFFQYVGYDSTAISRPIFCQNFTVPGLGLLWITLLLRKKLHNSAKDGLRNPAPSSKKNSRSVQCDKMNNFLNHYVFLENLRGKSSGRTKNHITLSGCGWIS